MSNNARNDTEFFTSPIKGRKYTTYHCRYCHKEIIIKDSVYYRCGWCAGKICNSCWDNEEVIEERTCDNCTKTFCHYCTRLHICPKCDAKICGLCKKEHINEHDKMTIENLKAEGKKGADLYIPDNKAFGSDFYDY